MEEILTTLIDNARNKGICGDGYRKMLSCDRDSVIDYYTANPDWCLERNFPDLKTLTENFSDCGSKGVYVNKTFSGEVLSDLQTYIFHNCSGTIKVGLNVEKGIIPMLYVANGCRLRIVGIGDCVPVNKESRSRVPVYIFGKNDVSARDNKFVSFVKFKQNLI